LPGWRLTHEQGSVMKIHELGLYAMANAVRMGRLRSVDLVEACVQRIAEREPQVHAWAWFDPEVALAAARVLDQRAPMGPLHGVPIAVKDIMDTADMPTQCGSPIYKGRRSAWDASCVALARRCGALVLGKTVTTEFAYFAPGATANPRNLLHTPGGSSSGSAAAVADGMVPLGLGTQTAASVTRPASFCGVVGYKASHADFSLAGIKSFAASFDSLGTLSRGVADAQWMRWALMGETHSLQDMLWRDALRVGLCRTPSWDQADSDCQRVIESAAQQLAAAGMAVSDATLPPAFDALVQHHKTIMAWEAARSLAHEYDNHRALLSPQLCQLLEDGLAMDRSAYLDAQHAAVSARAALDAWMRSWDVLVAPSAMGAAPLGLHATGDPLFSRMWTLLGVPSITLPGGTATNGLPIGVQLVGHLDQDETLLSIARLAERAFGIEPALHE